MKLNVKALAIAVGAVWAVAVLMVGICHLLWPAYGGAFLEMVASIYPGFHPAGGALAVVIGASYAYVDGALAGVAVAWVYNIVVK